jgi:hypothetical protein
MTEKSSKKIINIFVAISFVIMITVNALANILPINGNTTGQVSDYYKNLFAPTGLTFTIWGLIYILLAFYSLYQLGFFQTEKSIIKTGLLEKVGLYFIISSIANALWIFSWHYQIIPVSMILMITILICLILIFIEIGKEKLSLKQKFFLRLPFSVYFGWITVATIANATTLLVSLGWNRFNLSEPLWTIIIIVIGFLISTATILKYKDYMYGLVIIWGYIGILIKHKSVNGFSGQYPDIINT